MGCKQCKEDSSLIDIEIDHNLKKEYIKARKRKIKTMVNNENKIENAKTDAIVMKIQTDAEIERNNRLLVESSKLGDLLKDNFSKERYIYDQKIRMMENFKVNTLTITDVTASKILPN